MPDINVTAIVLKRRDLGESDRRLTLFTRELGRMDVVARGARKSKSRLSGCSEPLVKTRFQIAQGPKNSYVTQAEAQSSFPALRGDYDRLMIALALGELFEAVTTQDEDAEALFDHLDASLSHLSTHEKPIIAFVWSATKLLDLEGTLPSWTTCVSSGKDLAENPAWVSPSAGGYVSLGHESEFSDRFAATAEALIGLSKLGDLEEPPKQFRYAEEALGIVYHFWLQFAHKNLPGYKSLFEKQFAE